MTAPEFFTAGRTYRHHRDDGTPSEEGLFLVAFVGRAPEPFEHHSETLGVAFGWRQGPDANGNWEALGSYETPDFAGWVEVPSVDSAAAEPDGCRWCGDAPGHHGRQFAKGIGQHQWVQPSDRQRLERMRHRRADRSVSAPEQQAAPEQADLRQRILAWREDGGDHELTPEQVEYNIASAELIQLGAYGHCKYWPTDVVHPREYLERLHAAQDRFENALLALVQPELAALREQLAARPGCPDPIECDHEAEAEQLREQLATAQAENARLAAALEVATVQHAKAIKDRDTARTSAKVSDGIQRAEKQLFDDAIRDLGGNPVDVQNLYAQLQSRTRQWKNAQTALADRDAEIDRLRALLAHDHAAAYHQGEPRDGLLWHCGRDHCTAPNDQPTTASLPAEPGNAEDCPSCRERRDLPYPFLCPGHPAT